MKWKPLSKHAPQRLLEYGGFINAGRQDEIDVLPAAPLRPALAAKPQPRAERWADLASASVRRGWVTALDFVRIFEFGVGNPKHAANRVVKRLRDNECNIDEHIAGGSGPHKKMVKISDLKHHYKGLS